MVWIIILLLVLISLVLGIIYLTGSIGKFGLIEKASGGKKYRRRIISLGIVTLFMALFTCIFSFVNAVIILLHFVIFRLLFGLIIRIVKKITKKDFHVYWEGWATIVCCLIYLTIGYILCNNVWMTKYTLKTDKNLGGLRIALFADSHLGTTFDAEGLSVYIDEMMEQNPDILFIAGDMIDDGTSREDMIECCRILGEVDVKYGVWFIFGNHDRGYYRDKDAYTEEDIVNELKKNGVHVMSDDVELIDDRFYVVGREDRSVRDRKPVDELVQNLDKSKYIIVLDHQPADYDAEAAAGSDLVLSGHTHGGQLFPVTYVGEIFHINDATYGYQKRKDSEFIVTSGISDWEIQFKTGTKSEYVIIDVE